MKKKIGKSKHTIRENQWKEGKLTARKRVESAIERANERVFESVGKSRHESISTVHSNIVNLRPMIISSKALFSFWIVFLRVLFKQPDSWSYDKIYFLFLRRRRWYDILWMNFTKKKINFLWHKYRKSVYSPVYVIDIGKKIFLFSYVSKIKYSRLF